MIPCITSEYTKYGVSFISVLHYTWLGSWVNDPIDMSSRDFVPVVGYKHLQGYKHFQLVKGLEIPLVGCSSGGFNALNFHPKKRWLFLAAKQRPII